jgi:hypothetical protein
MAINAQQGDKMDNPFDDLRKTREEAEARERRKREEAELQHQRSVDFYESMQPNYVQLSPMVIRVLEQLRQAAYPNGKVVSCAGGASNKWDPKVFNLGSWQIVQEYTHYGDHSTETRTGYEVIVELACDGNRRLSFLVLVGQKYKINPDWVSSGLSEKELITTLQKLHQP